ncbi:Nnf1-domain-containing protein [Aaosphaeria arxii CBS 175.79]|uniref:Nnf1-domain-containing protein n=1 Tax=Aaosphaeria arxii CBS 175.79 TaxID=1450172 RepID=A0A6A5YAZ9_9PLEO|nr:Nnf1-domain-containing protein [Aaosphaeria arxii CBS 175.79]KAF2021950.1 Nnf1-domain-containing protein [Aaosphaeria arxii CBS 175.79]
MPTATETNSRSPSPAPEPPVAEAPGPRAQGLIRIYDQAVRATLDKCSTKSFGSCFPTLESHNPDILEDLRKQIVDQLDRAWRANFEDILARRDVVKSINALEQCIDDAKQRKERAIDAAGGGPVESPLQPHTLSPAEIHLAHLMPFLEKHTESMNQQLSTTQESNNELLSTVTAQRAEIESLVRGLEVVIQDLEASAQMMAQDNVQNLGTEIRDLENEMKK